MYEGSVEKTQEKCECVNGIIKESIDRLNLTNLQAGDIIDYKTSYGIKDWDTLKKSKCFKIQKDDMGERLVVSQECKECQDILAGKVSK